MNTESNLMESIFDDLDVEELERRLEFAPWDPPPQPPVTMEPYCEPNLPPEVECGVRGTW